MVVDKVVIWCQRQNSHFGPEKRLVFDILVSFDKSVFINKPVFDNPRVLINPCFETFLTVRPVF